MTMASTGLGVINYSERGYGQGHVTLLLNGHIMLHFILPLFLF